MKLNRNKIMMTIGVLCILCAGALVVYNNLDDERAGKDAAADLSAVEAQFPSNSAGEGNTSGDMPAVDVDGHSYIGVVSIPSLGLQLPIQRDWSKMNLRVSPCRYKGSVYENNLIIAGHNYTRHFGLLRNLQSGDQVIVTDMNGRSFYYEVTGTEISDTFDVDAMDAGDWDLTVFTCTIGGKSRVTVRCAFTGKTSDDWKNVLTGLSKND